ncbi:zinc-dependent metalloprotease [Rhodocytophaga rosea]|uniref:Zinc-dependent metalloprotease n=1 Tax=Rhodocytophaga rosea TaxID=2704465 RepID=A0A6C0GDM5_9BACT|nr:zinc-dependent metalloprotease [Rhodocytophaga rosea]QHT66109.1 zinc-dependent metalloprotease [Rhodocytophaga rosea]
MKNLSYLILLFTLQLAFIPAKSQPRPDEKTSTIASKTAGLKKMPGFFNLYWEEKTGKLYLEIDKWDTEFLYVNSLPTGIGSNDIGLDRGQLGTERIVKFQKTGPKVLLLQPNYTFRAISNNADEKRAVEESFAQSVLWGTEVLALEGERALVDITSFCLRDAHNVSGTIKNTKQGNYVLDATRSAFHLPRTKCFPQNSEIEVTLTFTGSDPGNYVRSTVPTPEAITIRQHHSFVQLPDNGFKPRAFDPRSGYFGISYMDYATPISEPIVKRLIARHRLQKKNPGAALSEAVEPIVYYMDRGAPEPIRTALMEGASWWNQAFEAAGYKNAFRVELMPEGADPMDVRYNLIQWVHRSTRGWSYGGGVIDPRTGEIIKGHVTLGSLRVRQDFLIAEGLLAPYEDGKPVSPEMEKMALARLRQLAAHEVGHTLGISHNYIASTANRGSVMDYPHPLVKLSKEGNIDLSDAYADGIGTWDKTAIAYGYQDFGSGTEEKAALNKILADAIKQGNIFLTDQDARPAGSAHPATHLWDNGGNAIDELNRMMQVRQVALSRFSEKNIRQGMPMSTLEEVLVPLYMSHRYQVEAAAKVLGGINYTYAMRGDGQKPLEMISPEENRKALEALLATISPEALVLPEKILMLIPPRAFGYDRTRELFPNRTGGTFDAFSAAEVAANHTVGLLLNPERAARLIEYKARNEKYIGLSEVIDQLLASTWKSNQKPKSDYEAEVQRTVGNVVLQHLMTLSLNKEAPAQVRAIAFMKLSELREWLLNSAAKGESQQAQVVYALYQIKRLQENPEELKIPEPLAPPPGQPIGMNDPSLSCDW